MVASRWCIGGGILDVDVEEDFSLLLTFPLISTKHCLESRPLVPQLRSREGDREKAEEQEGRRRKRRLKQGEEEEEEMEKEEIELRSRRGVEVEEVEVGAI